jgi:hypothetical protein
MADTVNKNFGSTRDVKYVNQDFTSLKSALVQYAKTYFPNTYKDFSDASPGMMFIEQAAYVGDVLSFYTDYKFKESIFTFSSERKNVIALANYLGYKVRATRASTALLEVYQLIPAVLNSETGEMEPDLSYALQIQEHMQVLNSGGIGYITTDAIDFSVDDIISPTEISIFSRNSYNVPDFFLLKKTVNIIAGTVKTATFNIGDAQEFLNLTLPDSDVIDILDVRDSDNNRWYQVDYLAQDLVFISENNSAVNDMTLSQHNRAVPKLLKSLKTSRKFTVNVNADNETYIQFGPGTSAYTDEIVYPSAAAVGVGLSNLKTLNFSYDSSGLLKSKSMGQAPSNTQLTVTYISGGGPKSNCVTGDITKISGVSYSNDESALTPSQLALLTTVKNSLKVRNSTPATGGSGEETIDEIKQNAAYYFSSQNRAVTDDDYMSRIYSMPPSFGKIAKAFVKTTDSKSSRFGVDIYVLSYDENKNLVPANAALIHNLKTYLQKYKMMTDTINILDGHVINIAVEFKISVYPTFNKTAVLVAAIDRVKSFFDIDKWNFAQSINVNQLELEIAKTEGVQSIFELKLKNMTIDDGNYSEIEYNLDSATSNKIIFPSLDPSVFEVRYPNNDIRGITVR